MTQDLQQLTCDKHFLVAGTGVGAGRESTGAGRRIGSTMRTDIGRGRGGREIGTGKGDLDIIFFLLDTFFNAYQGTYFGPNS